MLFQTYFHMGVQIEITISEHMHANVQIDTFPSIYLGGEKPENLLLCLSKYTMGQLIIHHVQMIAQGLCLH